MKDFVAVLLALAIACGAVSVALAHEGTAPLSDDLPSAGLTPASPFYFLDRFGEWLQEFFTFDKTAKARLQLEFAAERVAEVKLLKETVGPDSPGVEVALDRLADHEEKADAILEEEDAAGEDVSELSTEIEDGFQQKKEEVNEILEEKSDRETPEVSEEATSTEEQELR